VRADDRPEVALTDRIEITPEMLTEVDPIGWTGIGVFTLY
jgi:hypothetical protein